MSIYAPILPTHEWHRYDRMPLVFTISDVNVLGHELLWRLFRQNSSDPLILKTVGSGITINSATSATVVVLETDYDEVESDVYEHELFDETIQRQLSWGPAHILEGRSPEAS